MSRTVVITIPGEVEGKRRHRSRIQGRRIHTYPDPDDEPQIERVRDAWREAGEPALGGDPIRVGLVLYTKRPKSHWRVGGELSSEGLRKTLPVRKPDVDNAAKAVLDALNGLLYKDDSQVVDLTVRRLWLSERNAEPFARLTAYVPREAVAA